MFELQNKDFANQKFAIAGKTVSADEKGRISIESQDVAEVLTKIGFVIVKGDLVKEVAKEEPKEAAAEPVVEKTEEPKEDRKSKKNRWTRSKE